MLQYYINSIVVVLRGVLLVAVFSTGVAAATRAAAADAPNVVVSVKPIHSLAAAVMAGAGTPRLLLKGTASPHSAVLKPSDSRALADAGLVIWIGEDFESFLVKPLRALAGSAKRLTLQDAQGVTLLKSREGGIWAARPEAGDGHGHEGHGAHNMHLWLAPGNAKAIVAAIAGALAGIDPANAARYRANAGALAARIDALDRRLADQLAPVRTRPYVVFHDAYPYFERHYGLAAAGAINVSPDRKPGARRLHEIREQIAERGIVCVFSEPQFEPAIVRAVIENTPARTGVLDPLGAEIEAGPDMWFTLMERLAAALAGCLDA